MEIATAQAFGVENEKQITLAKLTQNERNPFFKEIRDNCCPKLKDDDVERAFKKAFGAEDFKVTDFGEGYVTFSARLPQHNAILVTSRAYLGQFFKKA